MGVRVVIPTNNWQDHVVSRDGICDFAPVSGGGTHRVVLCRQGWQWCGASAPPGTGGMLMLQVYHGFVLALDLMVGNHNPIGRTVAEWVMNNHEELLAKYVIWGQRL
jgi:hypothetical protein